MSTTNDLARFAILDKFISDNKPHDKRANYFDISCRHLNEGKKLFSRMKSYTAPYYEIFGGCGYDSYGLYKSSENIIYLLVFNFQTIQNYIVINSENDL
jgi:hypothetical protein